MAFLFGGSRAECPELYRQASPTTFATADDPPFFFYHGEKDRLVPRDNAEKLLKKLRKLGVDAQMYVVPGKTHIPTFPDRAARQRAIVFLERVLKNRKRALPKKAPAP